MFFSFLDLFLYLMLIIMNSVGLTINETKYLLYFSSSDDWSFRDSCVLIFARGKLIPQFRRRSIATVK